MEDYYAGWLDLATWCPTDDESKESSEWSYDKHNCFEPTEDDLTLALYCHMDCVDCETVGPSVVMTVRGNCRVTAMSGYCTTCRTDDVLVDPACNVLDWESVMSEIHAYCIPNGCDSCDPASVSCCTD